MCESPSDDVSALAEAGTHAGQAAGPRARVVHHRDSSSVRFHHTLLGEQPAQLGAVLVAVHTHHRRADRLQFAQHLEGRKSPA